MWWFHIEFILYHGYSLSFLLPYGYLHLIVQTVGRASPAECSSALNSASFEPPRTGRAHVTPELKLPCRLGSAFSDVRALSFGGVQRYRRDQDAQERQRRPTLPRRRGGADVVVVRGRRRSVAWRGHRAVVGWGQSVDGGAGGRGTGVRRGRRRRGRGHRDGRRQGRRGRRGHHGLSAAAADSDHRLIFQHEPNQE